MSECGALVVNMTRDDAAWDLDHLRSHLQGVINPHVTLTGDHLVTYFGDDG